MKQYMKNPDAVEMAIYFHDVIYNTQAEDSENRSADFYHNAAMQSSDISFRIEVENLIKGTKWLGMQDHTIPQTDDLKLLHDIDFSIFAADYKRFLEYDNGIRKEYAHVPDTDFKAARGYFLNRFGSYGPPNVFQTPYFDNDKARENLKRLFREKY